MSKALTREQIHSMRLSAKKTFIESIVYSTRKYVEEYVSSEYENDKLPVGAILQYVITRKQVHYSPEIYAELKNHFPDCAVYLKVQENNRFFIPCFKQYILEISVNWD
jgi:hypothetical protein